MTATEDPEREIIIAVMGVTGTPRVFKAGSASAKTSVRYG